MDIRKVLGARLRDLRKRDGISQLDLSEKLGVEPPSVSRWESGANWPKPPQLETIAEIFNVPVSYLFSETPEEIPNREHVITRTELLEMIASGKIPGSLISPVVKPARPSPEEALAVLSEALSERRELADSLEKLAKFANAENSTREKIEEALSLKIAHPAPVDPRLAGLLSSIEENPSLLDLIISVTKGFETATKKDHARSTRGAG